MLLPLPLLLPPLLLLLLLLLWQAGMMVALKSVLTSAEARAVPPALTEVDIGGLLAVTKA
jgi:hypothetical protein